MHNLTKKTFEWPELNEELWKDFKDGSVSKDRARELIEDGLKFIINIQLLKKSSYLTDEMLRKATQKFDETDESLNKLKKNYNLTGLVQNLLGRKIEEMTKKENDGDIQTSFNRLEVLTLEAHAHDSLREHSKEAIDAIYRKNGGIIDGYLVKINVFNRETRTKETRYFLPNEWPIKTQKMTAWYLRQLQIRTTLQWMKKKGIEPRKRETPVETSKEKEKETPIEPEATPATEKTNKKRTAETKDPKKKKAAALKKKTIEKARAKEDEADVKDSVGISM